MFRKYYENTRYYECAECNREFTLTFWQWFLATMKVDFARYRFVKCPHCGARHWLKAKEVME